MIFKKDVLTSQSQRVRDWLATPSQTPVTLEKCVLLDQLLIGFWRFASCHWVKLITKGVLHQKTACDCFDC